MRSAFSRLIGPETLSTTSPASTVNLSDALGELGVVTEHAHEDQGGDAQPGHHPFLPGLEVSNTSGLRRIVAPLVRSRLRRAGPPPARARRGRGPQADETCRLQFLDQSAGSS